jgi:uncharacterized protein YjbI with pentapeptide repeats
MRRPGLGQLTIAGLVIAVLLVSVALVYVSQALVERDAFSIPTFETTAVDVKNRYEIAKLAAEVRQIRSDTGGSLFWLKMLALFVTVGGAVGGYLVGQSRSTRSRIAFEDRKNLDAVFQSIVKELSDRSAILRAAAAVKLGMVLKSFPAEWNISGARQEQLIALTKQVLAAALAIEKDPKVLKALTIAIALHRPATDDANVGDRRLSDMRGLDLSCANASDAYWARADFTYTDFYRARLAECSFRSSRLDGAQFREADLRSSVLADCSCRGTNFKLADLRSADLSNASLERASFEGAKVAGATLGGVVFSEIADYLVDISESGDGSATIPVSVWLANASSTAHTPRPPATAV